MASLSPADRALGDVLVARRILNLAQFDEAVQLAEKWSERLGDAILSRNWIRPEALYQGVAYHYDLPFVDLVANPPDSTLLVAAEAEVCAQKLTVPWMRRGARIVVATAEPGPETILFARRRWGSAIDLVIASKFDIIWAVQSAFAETMSRRAVMALAEQDPAMSARQVFTPAQIMIGYTFLSCFLIGLAFAPIPTLIALNIAMSAFYLGNFVFKGILVSVGGGRSADNDQEIEIAARALREEELPVFTVLVPMYREHTMLPGLADSLRNLDYPLGKLDIKIVLEADDHETIEAARTLGLEGVFEIIRVPPSQPQTKPKACNFALQFARGEHLVVFDAEDRPEPEQLRKVVATFRRSPPNTACLQCRLNYYNAAENRLTRMFTLDYSLWFDQVLPGLERLNMPIPLGGTSNHFKIEVLRELHGWDPFNVTEDADIGIRLTQKGYRVGVVDSTTFEEATCHVGNWIRQRSRWMKGGLLACAWFLSLRNAGLSLIAAGATTLLLIFHPGLLRPAVAGPSEILLVVFLYMLGSALYDLRARSGVSEVMAVGLALVGLAFSHPMGAAIACAATPFLIFTVRPALVANSAINVVLTLVFPTLFSAAAFAYVSWVFLGSGWSFLIAPAEGISTWTASFTRGLGGAMTGIVALDAGIAVALAFVLSAPIAVIVMIWVARRRPLVVPALVLFATTVAAAVIAAATGLFGDPVAVTAMPPVLAAIVMMRVPDVRTRLGIVLPLLAIGWIGGAVAFAIVDPRITAQAGAVLARASVDPARTDALDLGGAIIAREGVLVDSVNAPAVVVGRGSAAGLITPPDENFGLAILLSTISSPLVAVPDPQSNVGAQDRLKAFPQLYQHGPPGYQLVYHNTSWRLFARR
jgi:cellulose synthase/poly-beta-1,6-N-acetylglucosamine synthase-like glycosyltransferase